MNFTDKKTSGAARNRTRVLGRWKTPKLDWGRASECQPAQSTRPVDSASRLGKSTRLVDWAGGHLTRPTRAPPPSSRPVVATIRRRRILQTPTPRPKAKRRCGRYLDGPVCTLDNQDRRCSLIFFVILSFFYFIFKLHLILICCCCCRRRLVIASIKSNIKRID